VNCATETHSATAGTPRGYVGWTDSGYVVTRSDGKPLDPNRLRERFQAIVKALGLPPVRFHDLRHAAARYLLDRGIPVNVVARQLGHDPRVLLSTYAHEVDEASRRAAGVMAEVGYGAPPVG
jgi:integrase